MIKQVLVMCAILFLLTGCERHQKNTNTVFNKEKASDFTTKPPPKVMPPAPPMLPGKAQILGAPFNDFKTQTGQAEVMPKKGLIKALPE